MAFTKRHLLAEAVIYGRCADPLAESVRADYFSNGLKEQSPNPRSKNGIKLCRGLKANPRVQQMP